MYPFMEMDGLADYDRNGGYVDGAVTLTSETVKFNYDRGRAFSVEAVSSMNKQELKEKVLPLHQANITVRNFPLSADALRRKLKIKDGGNHYLFATTLANGSRVLLLCKKIVPKKSEAAPLEEI